MTLESLFFLLLVAFVVLANVILPWLRRRLEGGPPADIEPQAREVPRRAQAAPPGPAPSRGRFAASEQPREGPSGPPLPSVAPPRVRRARARWPVANLGDARRGIVLMTILGPCRGVEPYDPAPKRPL
jgi:hypothetical protein